MSSVVRVLVVDDSGVMRRLLKSLIDAEDDLTVVGDARDGEEALSKIAELRPDVVLLDVEMPRLNGLETLAQLKARGDRTPVIMFSALTDRGAEITIDALLMGARGYVPKPRADRGMAANIEHVRQHLLPRLRALASSRKPGKKVSASREVSRVPVPAPAPRTTGARRRGRRLSGERRKDLKLLVLGASTGGPRALATLLAGLPPLPVPTLIVQHMPFKFTERFALRLDGSCEMPVFLARDGAALRRGQVWLAPGASQMTVEGSLADGVSLRVDPDAALVNGCSPSLDVLLWSVARVYPERSVLCAVLTGMGQDGLDGCQILHEEQHHILAQDERTSVVWGMPGAVVRAGVADEVLAIEDFSGRIQELMLIGR